MKVKGLWLPVPVGSVGYEQTHCSEEETRVLPGLWDLTEKG
jgi:hypothetical protein